MRARLDSFAARLAEAGAQVVAVPLPVPLADGFATWRYLTLPTIGAGLPDAVYAEFVKLETVPGDDPELQVGRAMTSRYKAWLAATDLRQRQRAAWAGLFEQYDVVLAPVMATTILCMLIR